LLYGYGATASGTDATRLDFGRSLIAVDYPEFTTSLSPLTAITDRLVTGFNGGTWDGPGIISSDILAADPAVFTVRLTEASAIGITGPTPWAGGATIDATTVLFGFTFRADNNLDQSVGFTDLLKIAQNFGLTDLDPLTSWSLGDSSGDGIVNFTDLLAVAQQYGASVSITGDVVVDAALHDAFWSDWALARSIVPEPTTLALASAGLLVGLRRRRA
jgi:hypothetical protein